MRKIYKNIDELLKVASLDKLTQHDECFRYVVNKLNYKACKQILLSYLDIETIKEAYKNDRYLNNIYKHNGRGRWEWDFIGDNMLHNCKATVKFSLMSDCNKTCIAKACARMICEEEHD